MATPRFYVPDLPQRGSVLLPNDESRHCSSVLRLKSGDDVILFDGQGGEAQAVLEAVMKREVHAQIIARLDTDRELRAAIQVFVSLPKGDRQKSLVEASVQLGVSRLVPLESQRSVSQPTENAMARLRRQVVEASKQCGRNQLMEIAAPLSVAELPQPNSETSILSLVAHPYADAMDLADIVRANWPGGQPLTASGSESAQKTIQLAIGPEGGFSEDEVNDMRLAGWTACKLGRRILRVETALLAGVASLTAMLPID